MGQVRAELMCDHNVDQHAYKGLLAQGETLQLAKRMLLWSGRIIRYIQLVAVGSQ